MFVSIWDVVRAGATCEQMQNSEKENCQTSIQRVPGSPSHINSQHMRYQYRSAAPIEANASYVVSIWDVVRAGPLVNKWQNSQKYNFQTNFQRVPGSPSCTHRSQCKLFCVYNEVWYGREPLVSKYKIRKNKISKLTFNESQGVLSHINPQHMPYQYCSAAPIEANARYVCVYVRCGTGWATLWTNTKLAKRKFPS